MAGNAQVGRKWEVLERVVAILLALANLAERAAGAPHPVRCVVLWILRRAEAVAQEFVAGSRCAACRPRSPDVMPASHGAHPADAIALALSFRMLALALQPTLARLRRQAFLHRSQPSGAEHRPLRGIRDVLEAAIARAERPDTS